MWFRDDRLRSAFEAQVGLRVVVHGRIDLFEPQGALQLYVESLQPAGFGDLALRFEELKARLAAEGLFESERKRKLPIRPGVIAVITSPTGAVWKDIATVLGRRWPLVRVVLVATKVQGADAPASIVSAFHRLERHRDELAKAGRALDAPQVTILARGGGSLEDLWSFNDERVVRAVVAHPDPGRDRRRPRGGRDAGRLRGRRPRAHPVRRRGDRRARPGRDVGGPSTRRHAPGVRLGRRGWRSRGTSSPSSAAPSSVVSPAARLVASREQVGLLFDRATRALAARLGHDRARLDRAASTLPRLTRRDPRGGSARASTPRRPRWPCSARRRPWTAATPSSAAAPTVSVVRGPADAPARHDARHPGRGRLDRRDRGRPDERVGERPMEYLVFAVLVVVIAAVGDPRWYAAGATDRPPDHARRRGAT